MILYHTFTSYLNLGRVFSISSVVQWNPSNCVVKTVNKITDNWHSLCILCWYIDLIFFKPLLNHISAVLAPIKRILVNNFIIIFQSCDHFCLIHAMLKKNCIFLCTFWYFCIFLHDFERFLHIFCVLILQA